MKRQIKNIVSLSEQWGGDFCIFETRGVENQPDVVHRLLCSWDKPALAVGAMERKEEAGSIITDRKIWSFVGCSHLLLGYVITRAVWNDWMKHTPCSTCGRYCGSEDMYSTIYHISIDDCLLFFSCISWVIKHSDNCSLLHLLPLLVLHGCSNSIQRCMAIMPYLSF